MILIEKALTFVVLFGILIFVHELGHFLAAKLFRFKVYEFAFGLPFGKKWRYWHDGETEYTVRAALLGGFVGFVDADADEETREHQMEAFHAKPIYQRFLVILAGPLFSLGLGWLALVILVGMRGVDLPAPLKTTVMQGAPAATAGIRDGDLLQSIDGAAVPNYETLVQKVRGSEGKPLKIEVERAGTPLTFTVQPKLMEDQDTPVYRIGVGLQPRVRPARPGEILVEATRQTQEFFRQFVALFRSAKSVKENVGGPIGIAQVVSEAVEMGGIEPKLGLMGHLSLSLFAANLFLPIPVFDGGQILLLLVEAIRRRQLSKEIQLRVMVVGWVMVLALFALVTFNDLRRLLFH